MGLSSIIVIGAPRSGTNMLRNTLTELPGAVTWPCDEINYIWRHGNARFPSDEFPPHLATPKVSSYIQGQFTKISEKYLLRVVVEKTCANSLRVGFVDRVLPEAKFIFLCRDGRDAVASAIKRWSAPLDIPYTLRKARFVPLTDLPYYASKYSINRIRKLCSKQKTLALWGPRFDGMEKAVRTKSLLEVCAEQWARCVEKSLEQLETIESERVYRIRYEDFVANPVRGFRPLCDFLGVQISLGEAERCVEGVSARSVGNWRREFSEGHLRILNPILMDPMKRLGYF